jgi:hypothetical protein
VIEKPRIVQRQEMLKGIIGSNRKSGSPAHTLHQEGRTISHHGNNELLWQLRRPISGKHRVHAIGQISSRIDEGAIQIENNQQRF